MSESIDRVIKRLCDASHSISVLSHILDELQSDEYREEKLPASLNNEYVKSGVLRSLILLSGDIEASTEQLEKAVSEEVHP